MVKHNLSDSDYIDGCLYNYSTQLTINNHNFSFSTSDGVFMNTTFSQLGPTVHEPNYYPPNLTNGGVFPLNGERYFTKFNFTINYIDDDNNAPILVNMTLDGVNFTMSKLDPNDNNYTNGCLFIYQTILDGLGVHEFNFTAYDGIYWNTSETIIGPTVQDTISPTLNVKSPLNQTYSTPSVEIHLQSTDVDLNKIWYTLYCFSNNSWITNQAGILIDSNFTLSLSNGGYFISFYCNDTIGNNNNLSIYFTINILHEGTPSNNNNDGVSTLIFIILILFLISLGLFISIFLLKKRQRKYTKEIKYYLKKGKL